MSNRANRRAARRAQERANAQDERREMVNKLPLPVESQSVSGLAMPDNTTSRFAVSPNGVLVAKASAPMTEMGETGLSRWGGVIDEEFLQELRGERGRKVYQEMRYNDPVCAAMLRSIMWLSRGVTWKASGENQQQVDFVDECLADMSHSMADFMSEALTMLVYGWAYFEDVYKWRKGPDKDPPSKYADGKIGWRKWAIRGQNTLQEWLFDDSGGLKGMKQSLGGGKTVDLPITKCLLFRTTTEKGNPEGESIFRPAYRGWYYLKNMQEIEGIGIERDLAGLPIVYLGDGCTQTGTNSDLALAKKLVRDVRRDEMEGVVIPKPKLGADGRGMLFELLTSGGRRNFDVGAVISRYEKRIAMCVLAQWLMLGMDQVGAYALSKDQSDFFRQAVEAMLNIIKAVIDSFAIPRLFKVNPGMAQAGKQLPVLEYTLPIRPDYAQFATAVNTLCGAGVLDPADESLRQVARFTMGLAEEEKLDPKIVAQREAEQKQKLDAMRQMQEGKNGQVQGQEEKGREEVGKADEGHWVTIDGNHVFITGDGVQAGGESARNEFGRLAPHKVQSKAARKLLEAFQARRNLEQPHASMPITDVPVEELPILTNEERTTIIGQLAQLPTWELERKSKYLWNMRVGGTSVRHTNAGRMLELVSGALMEQESKGLRKAEDAPKDGYFSQYRRPAGAPVPSKTEYAPVTDDLDRTYTLTDDDMAEATRILEAAQAKAQPVDTRVIEGANGETVTITTPVGKGWVTFEREDGEPYRVFIGEGEHKLKPGEKPWENKGKGKKPKAQEKPQPKVEKPKEEKPSEKPKAEKPSAKTAPDAAGKLMDKSLTSQQRNAVLKACEAVPAEDLEGLTLISAGPAPGWKVKDGFFASPSARGSDWILGLYSPNSKQIRLAPKDWNTLGTFLHELGHHVRASRHTAAKDAAAKSVMAALRQHYGSKASESWKILRDYGLRRYSLTSPSEFMADAYQVMRGGRQRQKEELTDLFKFAGQDIDIVLKGQDEQMV